MKKRIERGVMTLLLLCAVISAFYLRAENTPRESAIPVERVFARVKTSYRQQRDNQRAAEMQALSQLALQDADAAEALQQLIGRAEQELAVEDALAALGYADALCELRRDAAVLCVSARLSPEDAQRAAEVCAALCEISVENGLVLDECAYL